MARNIRHRSRNTSETRRLERIELDVDDSQPLDPKIEYFLEASHARIQTYWDCWHERPIEQYVACDFRYVWHAIQQVLRKETLTGRNFIEWGCGFGVVTALAWYSGLSAIGIEAELFLIEEGRKLFKQHAVQAELWHGNFLPSGAEKIAAQQSDHPSLFHKISPVYAEHDCDLDDFAIVFAYPWPGEEHFQREVFCRYAAEGALLLMFRGPYQIELYRQRKQK